MLQRCLYTWENITVSSNTVYYKFSQTQTRQNMYIQHVNIVAMEKQLSITHSECVSVALVIHHTMCMCCITLSYMACLGLHIIPHFLIKCVFWFSLQLLSATFLTFNRILWDIIINLHRSSCKVPITLVKF
jgi:hypothetical protein